MGEFVALGSSPRVTSPWMIEALVILPGTTRPGKMFEALVVLLPVPVYPLVSARPRQGDRGPGERPTPAG
jgi:hypothetical protein